MLVMESKTVRSGGPITDAGMIQRSGSSGRSCRTRGERTEDSFVRGAASEKQRLATTRRGPVSKLDREKFERDGYVVLSLFSEKEAERLRDHFMEINAQRTRAAHGTGAEVEKDARPKFPRLYNM